jgi:hypothetical protein
MIRKHTENNWSLKVDIPLMIKVTHTLLEHSMGKNA